MAAIPSSSAAFNPASADDMYDVIVIGAGFSGIAATKALLSAGARVLCLEARDRVGGRVFTKNPGDPHAWSDLGGAYVGPTQDALLHWSESNGIKTYKVHTAGKNIFHTKKQLVVHEGTIPNINIFSLLDLNRLIVKTDALAATIDLRSPMDSPDAKLLDSMTAEEYLRQHAETHNGAVIAGAAITSLLTSEPSEVSMLAWAWYVRSGESLMRLAEAENAAQERKFIGGTGGVIKAVADKLPAGAVRLSSPVRAVRDWNGSFVQVETRKGERFHARYVIMAMAPTLYGRLEYSPPLPSLRQQLVQRMPMGCIIKTVVYYERAWWREAGYSGTMFSEEGPVWYSYDDCKPDGSKPAIMGFVLARYAREYAKHTKEERLAAITKQYARLYNNEAALHPANYEELDWSAEEFSAGCYVGVMPPQFMTNYFHEMRAPMGRVHFAGTETAYEWSGYIDGAIRAGDRAAKEVSELLATAGGGASVTALPAPVYPPSRELIPKPIGPTAVEKWLPTPKEVVLGLVSVLVLVAVGVVAWKAATQK